MKISLKYKIDQNEFSNKYNYESCCIEMRDDLKQISFFLNSICTYFFDMLFTNSMSKNCNCLEVEEK